MKLELKRFIHDAESTTGYLNIDKSFECFTLEDQHQEEKIPGETRIPAGTYEIEFNEYPTPLTLKYQNKYKWFKYHLQLQLVPNFDNVYIHIGNNQKHTRGCILIGDSLHNRGNVEDFISESAKAFERLYTKVSAALEKGEKVTIKIINVY